MPDSPQLDTDIYQRARQYVLAKRSRDFLALGNPQPETNDYETKRRNVARGLTPGGLTQQEQAEGRQFYTETLPRATVAGGVALAAAPFTGGMSLLPAMATEAGLVGGADLAYQTFRKALDPSRSINPRESFDIGATSGVGSGVTRGILSGATRVLGSMGGVQRPAVNEALSRGTGARTMFGKPGTTAEAELGARIGTQLEPANTGITEGRLATVAQLNKQQAAGQMIDMTPTLDEMDSIIARLEGGGIGTDARVALGKLKRLRGDIQTKYIGEQPEGAPPKVAVIPEQADYINQQLQDAIGNAYGRAGGKEATRALKSVSSTHTESFRAQTGTAESAAATKRQLDAVETLRTHLSEKTPEGFVRSVGNALMTEGESGGQSALMALREFDPSGKLEKDIVRLAAKREWTGSESRIAHNIKFELLRRIPRFLAKLTGVSAKPAGAGVGAAAAFYSAMDPRNNP